MFPATFPIFQATLSCILQFAWPSALLYATSFMVLLKIFRAALLKLTWAGCPKPGLGWMDGGWIVSLPLLLALRDPLNLGALGSMRKISRRTDARAAVG